MAGSPDSGLTRVSRHDLHYGEITFCVDLMYVNKVPLLVTLSHNIKFGTMEVVADHKEAMLIKCIKGVVT